MVKCKDCLSNGGAQAVRPLGSLLQITPEGTALGRFVLQGFRPKLSELGDELGCSRKTPDTWTLEM